MSYDLICKKCGFIIENPQDSDFRIDEDGNRHFPYCPHCNKIMCNKLTGGAKGDYYHVSESMGINAEQTAEHRRIWPNVDVLSGGRLGFKSVKEQQKYANHFGLEKKPQKIKTRKATTT